MLYLAIPAHNEVATIGVLLWRLRTVLDEFPREYEVVVYDDASTDETADVAEQYAGAMPVTVLRGKSPVGYAGALDALVRHVSAATRYPRRDAFLLLQGDFTDPPGIVPEFARRFEGGADVVVGERTAVVDAPLPVKRLFSAAGWTLKPFVRVDGVRDLTGSMRLVRISVLRDLLRTSGDAAVASGDSWTANADFLLRLVPHARRVESVPVEPTYGVRMRETRRATWRDAVASLRWGWTARGRKATPTTAPESAADRNRDRAEGARDAKGEGARDTVRDSRDTRDTRDSARDTRDAGREGTRESARDAGREGTRRGREASPRDTSSRDGAPRPPRAPRADARSENGAEPRARRAPRTETLEESAERAAERDAARAARRDASRESSRESSREGKGGAKREGRSPDTRNADARQAAPRNGETRNGETRNGETRNGETPRPPRHPAASDEGLLNDPFAAPPRRESPYALLDDERPESAMPGNAGLDDTAPDAGTQSGQIERGPAEERSPYAPDHAADAPANAHADAADEGAEDEPGEGEEGAASPGRKRRRNRRGRRRRGREGAADGMDGTEGTDSADALSDADSSGSESDQEAGESAPRRGPRASGQRDITVEGESVVPDSGGDGEPDGPSDDASDLGDEADPEARARRRGRRGRRGGARRSRGRGKRDGGEEGAEGAGGTGGGTDSRADGGDSPSGDDRPSSGPD